MLKKIINILLGLLFLVSLISAIQELNLFLSMEADYYLLRKDAIQVPKKMKTAASEDPLLKTIDFAYLQQINPDIVGWIYLPGTGINYPILSGETDETYLARDYTGAHSELGSIFTYTGADLETDLHLCLFGHNMISHQMFGNLKAYNDRNYASEHLSMYIYTPGRTKECRLISVFGCLSTDSIFGCMPSDRVTDFSILQNDLLKRSILPLSDTSEHAEQIVTLSTCDGYTGTPKRFTVHFAVTKEQIVLDYNPS